MTPSSPTDNRIELATFQVGEALCGMDIHQIQEINKLSQLTRVPQAPAEVLGILNLRGQIVTVLDLAQRLGLGTTELVLAERPGIRVRVQPAEGGTLTVPAGADLWIVPSRRGDQSVEDPFLRDAELREGQAIAERFKQAGLKGFLAASRQPFEERALVYFPVELQVDAEGCIASIRMGDAARVQPRPTP